MTARVDTSDFAAAIRGLGRATGTLQKELTRNLHEAGPKIVSDIKGAAGTRIENAAAGTVDVSRGSSGIMLSGGGGGSLGGVLFNGAEYGGKKSKKVSYSTRSPRGKAYVVKRRTTMQFKVHLGREGHFFWPTMRDWLPRLEKIQIETVERVVGGGGR